MLFVGFDVTFDVTDSVPDRFSLVSSTPLVYTDNATKP